MPTRIITVLTISALGMVIISACVATGIKRRNNTQVLKVRYESALKGTNRPLEESLGQDYFKSKRLFGLSEQDRITINKDLDNMKI